MAEFLTVMSPPRRTPGRFTVEGNMADFLERGKPTVAEVEEALLHVGRKNEPELLYRLLDEGLLTRWAARRFVGDAWNMSDGQVDLDLESWMDLFDFAGYTVDGRRADRPAEPLTLYRGAPFERRDRWSWTEDLDLARWFATRFSELPGHLPARVWTAVVEPSRLFCRTTKCREGEREYVVYTDGLEIKALVDGAQDES